MGIGVGGGRCVLTSGNRDPIYDKVSSLEAGAIRGVQSHSMIRVINSGDALGKFAKGKREWELGVDASVAVTQLSANSDLLACAGRASAANLAGQVQLRLVRLSDRIWSSRDACMTPLTGSSWDKPGVEGRGCEGQLWVGGRSKGSNSGW
ncbi:MAG: hypothetical protein U9Q81_10205 [Pseudomonadota bacterium]|nr:hypothetical protein [Pseudomonadota bacterium]